MFPIRIPNTRRDCERAKANRYDFNNDAALIRAVARDRDERAFTELFHRHGPNALSLACLIVRQKVWAEEVVQEAMLVIWRTAASFRSSGNAKAWIKAIVTSIALKKRSKECRGMKPKLGPFSNRSQAIPPVKEGELTIVLKRRLSELSEAYRRIVVLYFWNGYTQDRIAGLLDMPQRTVSRRLAEALSELQDGMTRDGYSNPVG